MQSADVKPTVIIKCCQKLDIFFGYEKEVKFLTDSKQTFVTTDYRTLKAVMRKPLPLARKKLIIELLLSTVVIKLKKKSISRDILFGSVQPMATCRRLGDGGECAHHNTFPIALRPKGVYAINYNSLKTGSPFFSHSFLGHGGRVNTTRAPNGLSGEGRKDNCQARCSRHVNSV